MAGTAAGVLAVAGVLAGGGAASADTTITLRFAHCGLQRPLINLTVPGAGNSITLTLGKGRAIS